MKLYFKMILTKGSNKDMELIGLEKKDFTLHWIVIVTLTLILVISSVIFFIYSNYDGVDAETLQKEYLKKEDLTFTSLPLKEREKYSTKEEFASLEERYGYVKEENMILSKEVEKLGNEDSPSISVDSKARKISSLEKSKKKLKDNNHKLRIEIDSLKVKITKLENSVLVESSKVGLTSKSTTKYYDKENLKQIGFVSCKDMALGSYDVTKACNDKVKNYLSTTPKNAVYEIVAMVSEDDAKTISDISRSIDKLAFSGLGRFRMNEAKWLLIKYIGKNVKFKLVTYDTKTNESRGFVIKVYK